MKKTGMNLINKLRRVNIFYRFFFMFILATLLPMILFCVWSYNKNSEVIRDKVFDSVEEVLNQVTGELNQRIEKIRNDSIEISYMQEIQDVLAYYEKYNSRQLNLVKIKVSEAMSKKYVFDNIVTGITLYTEDHDKLFVYGSDVKSMDLSDNYLDEFLAACYKGDGKCVFRAVNRSVGTSKLGLSNEYAIVVGKAVKQSKTGATVGYMVMQVEEGRLSELYNDISYKTSAQTFLMDQSGIVVSKAGTGDSLSIGEPYPNIELRTNILSAEEGIGKYTSLNVNNKKMVLFRRRLEANDWCVNMLLPESYLQTGLKSMLISFAGISICCILLGIAVTFLFSASIVRPLNTVVDGIERFEKGELTLSLEEDGSDEITRLAVQFNKMAREINSLIEQEKTSEKQKRRLEIQALQAQINPHFLANTLNTVSYIAKIRKEETIEELINAIIELLRDSMKNDDSLHTIGEEIELIKSYIIIQDYRLLGKFSVDMQIDPNMLSLEMPRFILQPIIENAIIHGIEPLNRRGMITVKGYRNENQIYFAITDNGIGIEKEKILEILQEKRNVEKLRFTGMGMGNVDKRIKLLMGREYGLTIKSEKNVFTTVVITLPVVGEEENIDERSTVG